MKVKRIMGFCDFTYEVKVNKGKDSAKEGAVQMYARRNTLIT
jgi:hypothetical protein